jgi:hypothetical protein
VSGNRDRIDCPGPKQNWVVVKLKYSPGEPVAEFVVNSAAKIHGEAGRFVRESGRSAGNCFCDVASRDAHQRLREGREAAGAREANLWSAGDVVKRELSLPGRCAEHIVTIVVVGRKISGDTEPFTKIACCRQIKSVGFEAIVEGGGYAEVGAGSRSAHFQMSSRRRTPASFRFERSRMKHSIDQ